MTAPVYRDDTSPSGWSTVAPTEDTGQGHLFRFTVVSQGRTMHGDGYVDDDWGLEEEPWTAEVRAWDLPTALRRLADRGLAGWVLPEEGEET